ncbi:hypothetical protein OF83DRAFT_1124710 [Amylostereum chailletii]|nr:hypothetical protein OF83DRAFT_1124710 [Amylostereum chailletii]
MRGALAVRVRLGRQRHGDDAVVVALRDQGGEVDRDDLARVPAGGLRVHALDVRVVVVVGVDGERADGVRVAVGEHRGRFGGERGLVDVGVLQVRRLDREPATAGGAFSVGGLGVQSCGDGRVGCELRARCFRSVADDARQRPGRPLLWLLRRGSRGWILAEEGQASRDVPHIAHCGPAAISPESRHEAASERQGGRKTKARRLGGRLRLTDGRRGWSLKSQGDEGHPGQLEHAEATMG